MIIRFFFIFITLLCFAVQTEAHVDGFRNLTLRDGLPGMSVISLCEEPSGSVWIGTSNGIAFYNGMSVKTYALPLTPNRQPPLCLEIAIGANGDVWAATNGGLYRLRRYGETFERVFPEIEHAECLLLYKDRMYVGTSSGLYAIDKKERIEQINIYTEGVKDNSTVRCLREANGHIWLTLRTCILRIDNGKRIGRSYRMDLPSGLSRFDIVGNAIYVGSKNNGFYRLDITTGQFFLIDAISNVVSNVNKNDDGTLCIATDGNGAYLFDTAKMQIVEHYGSDTPDHLLSTDAVYIFRRMRNGILCFGTYHNGLYMSNYANPVFKPYSCGTFSTFGMKVTACLFDGGTAVIAVKGGFWIINSKTETARFIDSERLRALHITKIIRYGNAYYIGTYDSGLLRFDIATQTLDHLPSCSQLRYASVSDLAVSPQGELWVASGEGIFVVDKRGVKVNYTEKNSNLPISVCNMFFDKMGNTWIGCARGLCLYLAKEKVFKTGNFPSGFFNDAPRLGFTSHGDSIYSYSLTAVYRTDATLSNFSEIVLPQGILGEKVFDFMIDESGVKYISTERGLFRIDTKTGLMFLLSESWGLHGDIVSSGTLGQNDSQIWIATNGGLMVADKDKFTAQSLAEMKIPVEADEITIGQCRLTNGELLEANDRRELSIGWNIYAPKIVLRPVPVDFGQHVGEFFEYRLDGEEWHRGNIGQPVEISSLQLGNHELDIRMAGLEATTVSYSLYVRPTFLFYVEIFLLLIAASLLFLWYRWRKSTNILLREHAETEDALIHEINKLTPTAVAGQTALETEDAKGETAGQETDKTKYKKSRVGDKELARLFKQMEEYVREKKPYLDSCLKMSDIASALSISPSVLSQVFTLYLNEPYYDYINRYRLEEFKRLIKEGKHKQFTITALSEQCGFKKTAFFSTFRKAEGLTPTEYIQKVGK